MTDSQVKLIGSKNSLLFKRVFGLIDLLIFDFCRLLFPKSSTRVTRCYPHKNSHKCCLIRSLLKNEPAFLQRSLLIPKSSWM